MSAVIVLGAGPAGLMAALAVADSGRPCTLVEASDRVGGMAGSFEVGGQRVDFGSHRLHPATPAPTMALLQRLLGSDLQTRRRTGRLHLGGQWVGFPLRAGELLTTLPRPLAARLALDSATTSVRRLFPGSEPASFDDEIRSRFGATVADQFYGPYARKLYGLAPAELDPELARRRVSARSPAAIARRLVAAGRPEGATFLYPRRGYGQIAEALAEEAVRRGVDLRLGQRVTAVEIGADRVTVTTGPGRVLDGSTVLSTLPASTLASLVSPVPDPSVVRALARVRTRGMVLVYLVLDRPQYTAFDAHYVPGLETAVARLSEPKNYRQGDDPAGQTVLCAEIACDQDDARWHATDTDLGLLVADELARLGLPEVRPVAVETRRLGSVYPVYDRVGVADRATVERWTRTSGRLVMLGRQGLRVLDNLHHVMDMGTAAAAAIAEDGTVRAAQWHHELDRFATNTVED